MKVKVSIEKLKETVSPKILNQLLEDCEKSSRLVDRYGKKIDLEDLKDSRFLKSLLHHSIIIMSNDTVYALPLVEEGKELKIYYRKI